MAHAEYHYDPAGQLADTTTSGVTTYAVAHANWAYAPSVGGVANAESYSYDPNGNRANSGYSTGTGNQLLSDGTYSYQYDAEGNCTCQTDTATGATTHYAWDYRNRLTDITCKDPQNNVTKTIHYTYDAFNRRIGETVTNSAGTSTQWFVYDGQNVVLQLNAAGGVTERYLCGPAVDQVLAEENGSGVVSWLLADNQGSVRDVVQFIYGLTTNVDHICYSAYGQIAHESNASYNPGIGYTGQYWDVAAGMYYCEARWYDPSTGRYMSDDPTGFSAGDANLYRYVFNDPTNLVDPTGEVVGGANITPMLAAALAAASAQDVPHISGDGRDVKDYYDLRLTQDDIDKWGKDAAKVRVIQRIARAATGRATAENALGIVKEGGFVGCGALFVFGIANSWNPIGMGVLAATGLGLAGWGAYDLYVAHQIGEEKGISPILFGSIVAQGLEVGKRFICVRRAEGRKSEARRNLRRAAAGLAQQRTPSRSPGQGTGR